MTERIVPLIDLRNRRPIVPGVAPEDPQGHLADALGRPLRDLRISVTDRCNFRCTYCMPKEYFDRDHVFLPHSALLSFEELARVARIFVAHGVQKIRLTGGEPLLRRKIESLIEMLAELRTPAGTPIDLTLTTNGALLARKAKALRNAGLRRVTVSLDALDDATFRRMNDVDFPVHEVLAGIDAAQAEGFAPLKVNMVVQKNVNDGQILPMARYFRSRDIVLRFIEFMDVGTSNGWRLDDVVPSAEVIALIDAEFPLEPAQSHYAGEVAERWRYRDGAGEIGVISSVTQAFCGSCTRARLSTDGQIYTCLFGSQGHDLRSIIRDGATDAELAGAIAAVWRGRLDRYSELRSANTQSLPKVEMSYIGG